MNYSHQLKLAPVLLLSILLLIFIEGCNSSSKKTLSSLTTVGVNGGEVKSNDGLLKLIIPAGALLNDTEIGLESFIPDIEIQGEGVKRFYQAKPDGLTFATPAILEADVSEFFDSPNLPILLSASVTEGGEVLGNQEINTDFENGTSTIRGEVNHFSTFSVLNSQISVELRGVPLSSPANSPIDSINLFAKINIPTNTTTKTDITVDTLSYFDISSAPVFFDETSNPVDILQELSIVSFSSTSFFNELVDEVLFPLDYRCGDPGFGKLDGVISIKGITEVTTVRRVNNPVLSLTGGLTVATEAVDIFTTDTKLFTQTLRGRRVINCAGVETTEPEDPPEEPVVEPPVEPAASLTISEAVISFVHVKTMNMCPQEIKTVTITNTGNAATDVSLSSSTIALSTDIASFSLAPDASKEVTIFFTCTPPESFTGTISFTGNNTSTTLMVNGDIQDPP